MYVTQTLYNKVTSKQRAGTAAFKNHILLSKPERKITEITNIQDAGYSILAAFSKKRWPFRLIGKPSKLLYSYSSFVLTSFLVCQVASGLKLVGVVFQVFAQHSKLNKTNNEQAQGETLPKL